MFFFPKSVCFSVSSKRLYAFDFVSKEILEPNLRGEDPTTKDKGLGQEPLSILEKSMHHNALNI